MSFNPFNNDKRYIIQLKKDVNIQHHFTQLQGIRDRLQGFGLGILNPPAFTVSHTYSSNLLGAYVGELLDVAHMKGIRLTSLYKLPSVQTIFRPSMIMTISSILRRTHERLLAKSQPPRN